MATLDTGEGVSLNAADSSQIKTAGGDQLRRTAWIIVVLLLPVALLNYLDRQMLASM